MRRAYVRARWVGIGLLIWATTTGCANDPAKTHANPFWDRFNHLHDDERLKRVENASGKFEEFAGGEASFNDSLVNNVKTDTELAATANAVRADLDDKLRAYLTTDMSWRQLRTRLYNDLGVESASWGIVENGRWRGAEVDPEYELSERVQVRQLKLAAVVRAMALLGEAQAALLKHAEEDAKKAAADTAALEKKVKDGAEKGPVTKFPELATEPTTKPTSDDAKRQRDKLRCARVKWVIDLVAAFESAGEEFRKNEDLLKTATELQRQLLADIRDSADPASTKALIAVLGTGLRDEDFYLLDDYLAHLNAQIKQIKAPEETAQPSADPSGVSLAKDERAWLLIEPSLYETQLLLELASRVTVIRDETMPRKTSVTPLSKAREETMRVLSAQYSPVASSAEVASLDLLVARHREAKERLAGFDPYQIQQKRQAKPEISAPPEGGASREPRQSWKAVASRQAGKNGLGLVKMYVADDAVTKEFKSRPGAQAADPSTRTIFSRILGLKNTKNQTPVVKELISSALAKTSLIETVLNKLNLHSGADALKLASDRLALANDALDNVARDLDATVKGDNSGYIALLATALKFKAEGADNPCDLPDVADDQTKTALGLFQLILRANPKLTSQFGKLLDPKKGGAEFTAAMNQIGTMVNQGLNQVLEARLRIQQYIGDLVRVQSDLAAENARHTQTMLTLANLEVQRWALIGELLDQYSMIYDPANWLRDPDAGKDNEGRPINTDLAEDWTWPPANMNNHPMSDTWRIRLFGDKDGGYDAERNDFGNLNERFTAAQTAAVRKTDVLGKSAAQGQAPSPFDVFDKNNDLVRRHPFISRDDSIVASIRKLADTVRSYHRSEQLQTDPLGWNLTRSNVRLQRAVALVDGTLLLLSGNEHSARENGVRLQSETTLHALRLDSFERRTYEAGYRLTLGDIKAFHVSGITEEDLKVFESAALAVIGVRVGK